MKHEPGPFKQDEEPPLAELIEQARTDYAADLGVDHAVVSIWLRTWGSPDCRPFEEWLAGWNA